jgi:hypothetical protein
VLGAKEELYHMHITYPPTKQSHDAQGDVEASPEKKIKVRQ